MSQPFDFDNALKALQDGQALTGKNGILTPLIKQLAEAQSSMIVAPGSFASRDAFISTYWTVFVSGIASEVSCASFSASQLHR
jgi:hypothetical protein